MRYVCSTILLLTLLGGCGKSVISNGGSTLSAPSNYSQSIQGSVSYLMDLILPSAMAQEDINGTCQSECTGDTCVKLTDLATSEVVCSVDLKDDGTFEFNVADDVKLGGAYSLSVESSNASSDYDGFEMVMAISPDQDLASEPVEAPVSAETTVQALVTKDVIIAAVQDPAFDPKAFKEDLVSIQKNAPVDMIPNFTDFKNDPSALRVFVQENKDTVRNFVKENKEALKSIVETKYKTEMGHLSKAEIAKAAIQLAKHEAFMEKQKIAEADKFELKRAFFGMKCNGSDLGEISAKYAGQQVPFTVDITSFSSIGDVEVDMVLLGQGDLSKESYDLIHEEFNFAKQLNKNVSSYNQEVVSMKVPFLFTRAVYENLYKAQKNSIDFIIGAKYSYKGEEFKNSARCSFPFTWPKSSSTSGGVASTGGKEESTSGSASGSTSTASLGDLVKEITGEYKGETASDVKTMLLKQMEQGPAYFESLKSYFKGDDYASLMKAIDLLSLQLKNASSESDVVGVLLKYKEFDKQFNPIIDYVQAAAKGSSGSISTSDSGNNNNTATTSVVSITLTATLPDIKTANKLIGATLQSILDALNEQKGNFTAEEYSKLNSRLSEAFTKLASMDESNYESMYLNAQSIANDAQMMHVSFKFPEVEMAVSGSSSVGSASGEFDLATEISNSLAMIAKEVEPVLDLLKTKVSPESYAWAVSKVSEVKVAIQSAKDADGLKAALSTLKGLQTENAEISAAVAELMGNDEGSSATSSDSSSSDSIYNQNGSLNVDKAQLSLFAIVSPFDDALKAALGKIPENDYNQIKSDVSMLFSAVHGVADIDGYNTVSSLIKSTSANWLPILTPYMQNAATSTTTTTCDPTKEACPPSSGSGTSTDFDAEVAKTKLSDKITNEVAPVVPQLQPLLSAQKYAWVQSEVAAIEAGIPMIKSQADYDALLTKLDNIGKDAEVGTAFATLFGGGGK